MSRLEASAQHIVGPLICDLSIRLDEKQQEIISRWAFKTSMVMESMARTQEGPFYSDEECRQLRVGSSLPFRSLIWLGRYGGRHETAAIGTGIWNDVPNKPGTIHGYVGTIVAGKLAIQLLTFHVPEPYSERAVPIQPRPGPWTECLIDIHPFRTGLSWPPPLTISNSGRVGLDALANRWSAGVYPPRVYPPAEI